MIKGVGIDLMDMNRVSRETPSDDAFVRKVFTEAERVELSLHPDSHEYLCSRFSMKEAVYKSLGRDGDDFVMTDIEILADDTGRPVAKLLGRSLELAREAGISNVLVSVSFDGNLVTSVAVADGPVRET